MHRTERNLGFGGAVNAAVGKTTAERVLVLNSDVVVRDDFLAALSAALDSDPALAAVTPIRQGSGRLDTAAYARSGGVIRTFTIRGFAILMRRRAFEEARGFDPVFGRGYFEDTDLSRRWVAAGWHLGVVPDSVLEHAGHGSFDQVSDAGSLMERNRQLYRERYPASGNRLLVVDAGGDPGDRALLETALAEPLREGATVEWRSRAPAVDVPAIEIRVRPFGTPRTLLRLASAREREPRRYTDLWTLGGGFRVRLLAAAARSFGIRVRHFSAGRAQ